MWVRHQEGGWAIQFGVWLMAGHMACGQPCIPHSQQNGRAVSDISTLSLVYLEEHCLHSNTAVLLSPVGGLQTRHMSWWREGARLTCKLPICEARRCRRMMDMMSDNLHFQTYYSFFKKADRRSQLFFFSKTCRHNCRLQCQACCSKCFLSFSRSDSLFEVS